MRKLVMGMAALGVLAGGGSGAYFYLKKPAEAALPEKHGAQSGDHAAKGEGQAEAGGELAPIFVKMDPVVVPILDADGISQTVSMVITFEVKDSDNAKKVEDLKPRIKDALITSLYGVMNNPAVMEKGVLNVGYVKRRLGDATRKVMGEDGIKEVLLQMVQQNPL